MRKRKFVAANTIAVLSILMSTVTTASWAETVPNIRGRVHATTDDLHFVMQTENFFFRINRSKISPQMQKRLLDASIANIEAEIAAPADAIDLKWPTVRLHQKDELQRQRANITNEPQYFRVIGEKVQLRGTIGYSTDSSQFFILSGLQLYQLTSNDLSESQAIYLKSKNIGDSINLTVDLGKAQKVGSLQQPPAPIDEEDSPDRFVVGKNHIEIVGTLVHSFSDPLVIVQVENTFFQLKKSHLPEGEFRSPGKRVDISAPMSAIDFVWSYERPRVPIRQPAHFGPVK